MPHQLISTDVVAAAARLHAGGLVAMPTETVYGLAADAENPAAVALVYAVKGRPTDHPLIVHLHSGDQLTDWACDIPPYAARLATQLWPGPLTLILPRTRRAGDHLTGGQDTVGLRVPDHPVAQALLRTFGGALAAPSANRFGRVSPTTAEHVVTELGEFLVPERDTILDAGPSAVGVESSIVDCTGAAPVILRPGAVTADQVRAFGGVAPAQHAAGSGSTGSTGSGTTGAGVATIRAPGMLASHYAPKARVVVAADAAQALAMAQPLDGLLALADVPTPPGVVRLAAPLDGPDYARQLYAALREADALGLHRVIALPPSGDGIGTAVADRLRRAAH